MKKICIITTVSSSIDNWIKPFLEEYHKIGVQVTVVCNMTQDYEEKLKREFPFVRVHSIAFPRGISLFGSLKSIKELSRFFKKEKFDMVQYSTPNASFYAATAAKKNKIPVRLYCQWGMVYISQKGIKRKIFEWMERRICKYSTNVQPDGLGNLEFCRKHKFYSEEKSCIIWNGSAKGIDLTSYDIEKKQVYASEIRQKYHIDEHCRIIGFVGRLGKEKGCNELFKAFQILKQEYKDVKLLFVGPIEKENTIEPNLLSYFKNCDDIIKTGRVQNVEKYMAAMDIFVLPSYREGFGMSVVEAQAMEIPVVVTKYPGPSSGMIEGKTGYAIKIGSVTEIVEKVKCFLQSEELRKEFGKQGRVYVEKMFERGQFTQKYMQNRKELLGIK